MESLKIAVYLLLRSDTWSCYAQDKQTPEKTVESIHDSYLYKESLAVTAERIRWWVQNYRIRRKDSKLYLFSKFFPHEGWPIIGYHKENSKFSDVF